MRGLFAPRNGLFGEPLTGAGSGSVTSVSVVSANGLAGSVATASTTPAITLRTSVTGILSGNGTAISAASTTGSGSVVLATTPTLVTPALGVATATSINGNAITTGTGTLTLSSFTLTAANTGTVATLSNAQTYTAAQRGAVNNLTDGATITPDFSLPGNFKLVLGGSRTLAMPTNLGAGQNGTIDIWQDITGSRTLTFGAGGGNFPYTAPGQTMPVLSTAKLIRDQLYFYVDNYSTSTVTVTIATPGVMTWTAHGMNSGQRIQLTTTGALPTGLATGTTYWVTVIDANTFNLSSSLANAQAAAFINTSGTQSGVHTAIAAAISISMNNNMGG